MTSTTQPDAGTPARDLGASSVVKLPIQKARPCLGSLLTGAMRNRYSARVCCLLFFLNKAPSSPLRLSLIPDSDPLPLINRLAEAQGEHISPQNYVHGERAVDHLLPDLTDAVIKEGPYPIAHGGYSDVWRGTWNRRGGVDDLKVDGILNSHRHSLISLLILFRSPLKF